MMDMEMSADQVLQRLETLGFKAKPEKTKCPYCGRKVNLTKAGMLRTHKTKTNGPKCVRSGGRPN